MESYPTITSAQQLAALIDGNKLTIIAFYKSAHQVLDTMGLLAGRISNSVRLARCDVNKLSGVESQFQITTDPTFIAFKDGRQVRRMEGVEALISAVPELTSALNASSSSGGSNAAGPADAGMWLGAPLAGKNYSNITSSVELPGLDILNANTSLGTARVLFEASKPSGKQEDGVESDTDEQLMLFIPFKAAVKLHSIQITSIPPAADDTEDEDEAPSRPRSVKLFCNTPHIVGFDEAEEREPTQTVTLNLKDWNKETNTATIATKFVKFQNCSAVTVFFVDVEREGGEKVRVDRIRLIGEVMGEKVDMSKLKQQEQE